MGVLLPPHRQWMLMKSYLLLGRNRQTQSYDREAAVEIISYLSILLVSHWRTKSPYEQAERGEKIISCLNLSFLQLLFGYPSTSWYDFIVLSQESPLNSTKLFPVNGQARRSFWIRLAWLQPGAYLRLMSAARSQTDWLLEGWLGDEGYSSEKRTGKTGYES